MNDRTKATVKNADRLDQRCGFRGRLNGAKQEMDKDKLGWLFLAVFVAVLLFISVYYWRHFYQLMTDDIAGEHLYSKKIWDTGNPFFPGFANSRELFLSRPWPIFLICYAFVRNVALASRIELMITIWLLAVAAVFFLRKLKWGWPVVFLAVAAFLGLMNELVSVFLMPLNNNVIFFSGILFTFGMFVDVTENRKKRNRKIELLLLYGMAVYFGLCGVRMFMYLYFPLAAVMVIKWVMRTLEGSESSSVQKNKLFHSISLLIFNMVAVGIYVAVIVPYMHALNFSDDLISYGTVWERIRGTFMRLFQGLDIEFAGGSFMLPRSILTIYKIALLGLLIWAGLYLRKADAYKEREKEALVLFLLMIGELSFIFTFTVDAGFPGRFFTLPMIVALMVGLSYNYLRPRVNLRVLCGGFCLFVLVGICMTMELRFPAMPSSSEAPAPLMQLTDHLEETGRSRIAGHYWSVSSPVFFSNCEITGMVLTEDDMLQPFDWIADRTSFVNDDEPVTLVLTEEQKDRWAQSEKRAHLLSIADGADEAAGYYLYDYDENPFAFDLYNALDYGLDIRYNFLQLAYTEGAALDDGNIVLHPGDMQYGPYRTMKAGTYDVTVRGEGLENGNFDVISGTVAYELENMEVLPNQVTYTVRLDSDMPNMEFRCINNSTETVKIRDITITPWDMKAIWE